jgi:hypothetical protein
VGNPEIGIDDGLVGLDLLRRAVSDLVPIVKHGDAIRQPHDDANVMLDQDDSRAEAVSRGADIGGEFLLLAGGHAGHRLVEQQQHRL